MLKLKNLANSFSSGSQRIYRLFLDVIQLQSHTGYCIAPKRRIHVKKSINNRNFYKFNRFSNYSLPDKPYANQRICKIQI